MGVPTTPGSLAGLSPAWRTFLADAPLGDSSFLDVAEQQIRFRVAHYPSGAAKAKPDSAFTAQLATDPATRDLVRRFGAGVVDLQHELGPGERQPFRGFSIARSEDGEVANRALHAMVRGDAPSQAGYEAALLRARTHLDRTVAVRVGPWIHLGADRGAGIAAALQGAALTDNALTGAGVKTLLHELHHVADPRPIDARHLDWLSEGRAETLARWPGQVEGAGERLGLDVPPGVGAAFDIAGPYQTQVASVRALLGAAGVRTDAPEAFDAAKRLTSWEAPGGVEHALATAIGAHLGRDAAGAVQIRDGVRALITHGISTSGEDADPVVVERYLQGARAAHGRTSVPTR